MHSGGQLVALLLGGVALAACGSSSSSKSGSSGGGDGGAESGLDGSGSGSSGSSSGGSSSGGSSSGGSSGSGSSSGPAGYAIPLTAPGGPDFEYTAKATIGSQTFALSIDTGSTTLAVAGTGCATCSGVSPLYTPSASSTATGQMGSETFQDGSGWAGPIYGDSVGLGNGSPSVPVDLVGMTSASGGFFDGQNDYQGILGLGPSGNAITGTTGYMPGVMSAGVTNIFAVQLCDVTGTNAGTMWLGGDGAPAATPVYTPLVPISDNNPYYAIDVNGMSLGGVAVVTNAANTFQQPILDTGTSLFYVPTSVFTAFEAALQASSGFKAVFGSNTITVGGQSDGCVTDASVTAAQVESMLPALTLSLPNASSGQPDVTIKAAALDTYLYDAGGGQFCLAMGDGGTQDGSTFGDAFLQAFVTIVDVKGSRVGFAASGCPTPHVHRVRHPVKNGPHRPARPVGP